MVLGQPRAPCRRVRQRAGRPARRCPGRRRPSPQSPAGRRHGPARRSAGCGCPHRAAAGRHRVAAQQAQQLLVRADDERLVAGVQGVPPPDHAVRRAPRRVTAPTSTRLRPVTASTRAPSRPPPGVTRTRAYSSGHVAGVERAQHVQAERRTHEPWRGELVRRPHVGEAERLADGAGQPPVEQPQRDCDVARGPPSASRTASPTSRLVRSSQVSTATALARSRLTSSSVPASVASPLTSRAPRARTWVRYRLSSSRSTTTTGRPGRGDGLHDAHAQRPQPDHHDVPAQPGHLAVAERLLQPPRHQQVGQQRVRGRGQHDAGEHEHHRERPQPAWAARGS